MKTVDLSVLIFAHDENLLAHKTMQSVFRSLQTIRANDISYEIIIWIYDSNLSTLNYLERYKSCSCVKIIESSFSDIALVKNQAIQESNGDKIALINTGDLISANWLSDALKFIQNSERLQIVYPEATVWIFPQIDSLWPVGLQKNSDSGSKEYEALRMLSNKPWPDCLLARRNVISTIPFNLLDNCFVDPDFTFSADAIASGIAQSVVPETTLFHHSRQDYQQISQQWQTSPHHFSELFDAENFSTYEIENDKPPQTANQAEHLGRLKPYLIRIFDFTQKIPGIRSVTDRMYYNWRQKRTPATLQQLPDWLYQEWRAINALDFCVFPSWGSLNNLQNIDTTDNRIGKIYRSVISSVSENVDYLFIIPWIIRGGADKVILLYADALTRLNPDKRFAVLATLPTDSPWRTLLPASVPFIDFGNLTKECSDNERELLMNRLVVQLQVKNIHIIQSEFGYSWADRQSNFMKNQHFNLYVSLFAYGLTEEGQYTSFADPYLMNIYPWVKKISTDNWNFVDTLVEHCGFENSKLTAHYMPFFAKFDAPKYIARTSVINILWASRIAKSKRPEILKAIAEKLDGSRFHIDVYGEIVPGEVPAGFLQRITNLSYLGPYDGVDNLPTDKYDIYLYTTESDGMPNVLLEMTAKGLPIIASNGGGVGEFIQDGVTGRLVNNIEDIDEYISKLNAMADDPYKTREMAENAQKLLQERHSAEHFLEVVKRDFPVQ